MSMDTDPSTPVDKYTARDLGGGRERVSLPSMAALTSGSDSHHEDPLRQSYGERAILDLAELPAPPLTGVVLGSKQAPSRVMLQLGEKFGCEQHRYGHDPSETASALRTSTHLASAKGEPFANNAWDSQLKWDALSAELAIEEGQGDVEGLDALGRSRLMYAVMRGQYHRRRYFFS